jgi:uncharacterized repeat protein (TIGR03803 family)
MHWLASLHSRLLGLRDKCLPVLSLCRAVFHPGSSYACRRWARQRVPRSSVELGVTQLEDRITPATLFTLGSFNSTSGFYPYASGVVWEDGTLYGTAWGGGASGDGTVFSVNTRSSGTINAVASFNGANGISPFDGVIKGDGLDSTNLYGTTLAGGAHNEGTIFEVAAGSGAITTLTSFPVLTGGSPDVRPSGLLDHAGNLWGTTGYGDKGASTIFVLDKGSSTIYMADPFNGRSVGPSNLIMDSDGILYGTTDYGYSNNPSDDYGTVFSWNGLSPTVTTLAGFDGSNGAYPDPDSGLTIDGFGNLYGVTTGATGQAYPQGSVFELAHGSTAITTLASFDGANGADPGSTLILDSSGNLYGTTTSGGTYNKGTIFELAHGSGTITTLASFNGTDGAGPRGKLYLDNSGYLYGTTTLGGAYNDGTVFALKLGGGATADTWTGASPNSVAWSDGRNWSLGTPPATGQTVLFTNNSSVQSLTSTVDAGFTGSIGNLVIDSTWGGTINVASPLTVTGNFTMAGGTLNVDSALAMAGAASGWTGGQIDMTGGSITNTGTLRADTTGGNLVLDGTGTLINAKSIVQTGTAALVLGSGTTLDNAKGASYTIQGNGGLGQAGAGTLVNAGKLAKSKGTGTATIATGTLSNTGTLALTSGTLLITAAVTQVAGSALNAGTWDVTASGTAAATLDIASAGTLSTLGAAAHVTLNGAGAAFSNVAGLSAIAKGGSFTLLGGQNFSVSGALGNNGGLTIGAGSTLRVGGDFSNSGTLTFQVTYRSTGSQVGAMVTGLSGSVTLGGSLVVSVKGTPPGGTDFTLLDDGNGSDPLHGSFRSEKLPPGYQLLTDGGDGNDPVLHKT